MKTVYATLIAGALGCAALHSVRAAEAATFRETVLYSFCAFQNCTDGATPQQGSNVIALNGILYGVTSLGGGYGHGTLFAIDLTTGKEKAAYSFCEQLQGSYCLDGSGPEAGLLNVNGTFYGTTAYGGNVGCADHGCGVAFAFDPNTRKQTVLHSFGGSGDGANPYAPVISVDGTLYGTTFNGGGAVFSIKSKTGKEKVLYFVGGDSEPFGGLTLANGKLYGTSRSGGTFNAGQIFSVDPATGAKKSLYSFCAQFGCPDGGDPESALLEVNGMLYGTTVSGGTGCASNTPPGCGTAFAFDPKTGVEAVVHFFAGGADGQNPQAGLIAVKGTLYGTTNFGGNSGCGDPAGCGTVFSLDPGTGSELVIYSFGGGENPDGLYPEASLLALQGTFYGTTIRGGAHGDGTVFALEKKR